MLVLTLLALLIVAGIFLRDLITPVVVAIFLAYLLDPIVDTLENRGLTRVWGIIIVFLCFAGLVWGGVALVRDEVAMEMQVILTKVRLDQPELLIEQLREKLKASFPGAAESRLIDLSARIAIQSFHTFFGPGMQSMAAIFSAVGGIIIVPFLTFFILKDSRGLQKAIVQQIPNRYFEMTLSLLHKTNEQLGRYIRGVLLDAAIVGALVMIALSLLDLRYAIFIGALAGMANLIPYLGPVVGGIPAIAISIIDSGNFSGVPAVLLAFVVVKVIDDVLVQPLVVSRSVELHPATVIIAIYIGGHVGGILGMVVAVPLVAIAKVGTGILHWGFTKYYIFGPPPFAVSNDEPEPPPKRLPPPTSAAAVDGTVSLAGAETTLKVDDKEAKAEKQESKPEDTQTKESS